MRKNRLFILGIITVMVALVSLSLVSSTFAKYTSSYSTTNDTAKVAKWDVEIGPDASSLVQLGSAGFTLSFDLFDTIVDTVDDAADDDVKAGRIIAPGTKGSATFAVKNASEVTAKLDAIATVTNATNVPLVFTLKVGSAAATTVTPDSDGKITLSTGNLAMEQSEATTIVLSWEWPFETGTVTNGVATGDAADTALGLAGSATVKVDVTFTAVQVD